MRVALESAVLLNTMHWSCLAHECTVVLSLAPECTGVLTIIIMYTCLAHECTGMLSLAPECTGCVESRPRMHSFVEYDALKLSCSRMYRCADYNAHLSCSRMDRCVESFFFLNIFTDYSRMHRCVEYNVHHSNLTNFSVFKIWLTDLLSTMGTLQCSYRRRPRTGWPGPDPKQNFGDPTRDPSNIV